jgi:hypothetical protein
MAEARHQLPQGLLGAIGQVESGADGGWNWSVNPNTGAAGVRFDGVDEARRFVEGQLASGNRMIDIGCFQIDLLYHPNAFRRWQDGFDAAANAEAAASILRGLYDQTKDWHQAIALYHSAAVGKGQGYLRSVLSAWRGDGLAGAEPVGPYGTDPYTIVSSGGLIRLVVWTPAGAQGLARRHPVAVTMRLPRVVVP